MTRQMFAWLAIAVISCTMRGQAPPLGERVAAQEAQSQVQAREIRELQSLPEKVASLKSEVDLVLAGIVAGIGVFAALVAVLWQAGSKLHDDSQHIRAMGHRLSSFMSAAAQVPELAERQAELEENCRRIHGAKPSFTPLTVGGND